MLRIILFTALFLVCTGKAGFTEEFRRAETFEDAHAASCRITAGNSRGTGTFIGTDDGNAYILTCDHVVKGNKAVLLDFWTNSQKQTINGVVVWEAFDVNLPGDFAFIAVNAETLKNTINPPFVALGGSDAKPTKNGFIVSSGAPDGRFPQAWKGQVIDYYRDATALFSPPPVPGQSGSGILEYIDGELYLTGVLTWLIGAKGADDSKGGAIPVRNIYIAMQRDGRAPTSLNKLSPIPPNASECADDSHIKAVFYSAADCRGCQLIKPDYERLQDEGEPVELVDVRTADGLKRGQDAGVVLIPTVVIETDAEKIAFGPEQLKEDAYKTIKTALNPKNEEEGHFLDRAPIRQQSGPIRGIMEKSENRWNERGRNNGGILTIPRETDKEEEETATANRLGDRIADRIANAMGRKIEEQAGRMTNEIEARAGFLIEDFLNRKVEELRKAVVRKLVNWAFYFLVLIFGVAYFIARRKYKTNG